MSLNISWLAVEGTDRVDLLARLGFEDVGETNNEFRAGDACAVSATGWLLIAMEGSQKSFVQALSLASEGRQVLACDMSEIAMGSDVRMLRDGTLSWSATYDPDKDPDNLIIVGQPPEDLADICAALKLGSDEDSNDLFEAPVDLAARICGYRPGRDRLDWTLLARKTAGRSARPRAKSLKGALDAELGPLVASLGWTLAERSDWYQRDVGGMRHDVWFTYGGGKRPYLNCGFSAKLPMAEEFLVQGLTLEKPPLGSRWRRLLNRLFGRPLTTAERIDQIVETACDDVHDIDVFLRTGMRPSHLQVFQGIAKDTWPVVPEMPPAP